MTKNEAYDYLTNEDNNISKDELIQYLSDCFKSEILTELVEHIKEEKGTNDTIEDDIEDE